MQIIPTDPKIVEIARQYNHAYRNKPLIDVIDAALAGSQKALNFIDNDPIINHGVEVIFSEGVDVENNEGSDQEFDLGITYRDSENYSSENTSDDENMYNYVDYLHAVAAAQMHIKREGKLPAVLNKMILKTYPKDSRNLPQKAREVFIRVSGTLGDDEDNFLNYVIDVLEDIYMAKELAAEPNADFDFEKFIDENSDFDSEVTSGVHGFKLDPFSDECDEITDWLEIAVKADFIPK